MNFKSDKRLYRPQEIIKLRNQIKSQENNVFYDFNSNRSFYEKRNKSQNLFNKSNSKYESYYNTLIQNSVNKRKKAKASKVSSENIATEKTTETTETSDVPDMLDVQTAHTENTPETENSRDPE